MPRKLKTHRATLRERREAAGMRRHRLSDSRPNAGKRGYGGTWRKAREWKLRRNPICEECLSRGEVVAASEVHHIVPLDEGGANTLENLMSLCRRCHARVTHGTQRAAEDSN